MATTTADLYLSEASLLTDIPKNSSFIPALLLPSVHKIWV